MLEFLKVYRVDILVMVLLGLVVGVVRHLIIKFEAEEKARAILLKLCVEADAYFDTGQGKERKKLVLDWFFGRYKFIGLLVSADTVSKLIDNIVDDYINRHGSKAI